MIEHRVLDLVNPYDRIERALVTDVTELGNFDVVWNRLPLLRDGGNIVGRHVNEFRERVYEASDQPWAGDTIDLGVLTRDPFAVTIGKLFARGNP